MKAIILATTAPAGNWKCAHPHQQQPSGVIADILVMMCGDGEPRTHYFCAYHYVEFTAEILDWLSSHGAAITAWYPQ